MCKFRIIVSLEISIILETYLLDDTERNCMSMTDRFEGGIASPHQTPGGRSVITPGEPSMRSSVQYTLSAGVCSCAPEPWMLLHSFTIHAFHFYVSKPIAGQLLPPLFFFVLTFLPIYMLTARPRPARPMNERTSSEVVTACNNPNFLLAWSIAADGCVC